MLPLRLYKHLRFLHQSPKASLRILSGVFKTHLLKQRRLRNCQLALTFACNHTCSMCSSNLLLKKQPVINLQQWKIIIDQLKDLGCVHFDLTGGEPTLKGLDFLEELIGYITFNQDCIVSLSTNGKLIDRKWVTRLKNAGLNSFLLNIQSLDSKTHDEIVGDLGNLEKIKSLIPIIKAEKLNICINTCMGSYNVDTIEELIRWCERQDVFVLINLAAPTGRLSGKDVRITTLKQRYYQLLNTYPLMRSDTSYNYRGHNLCPGGIEKIYITAYGDVMQCTFCQISFGNVLKEPLREIYDRFSKHRLIRERFNCKHSFHDEFRQFWIEPIMDRQSYPIPLKEHPYYSKYIDAEP